MINGVRISEIPLISSELSYHRRRLQKIHKNNSIISSNSRRHQTYSFDHDKNNRHNLKQYHHSNWKQFIKHQKQKKLAIENNYIFQKLNYINNRKTHYIIPINEKQINAPSFIQRKKRQKYIIKENNLLEKKLMAKTGQISHRKDLINYYKTRQLVNRLQKFQTVRNLLKVSRRSKTLPIRHHTIQNHVLFQTQLKNNL